MKILFIMLILVGASSHAAVYKSINSKGDVVYSDTPTPGSERLKLPELPTYTPPPITTISKPSRPKVQNDIYEDFTILKPENDATFRDDQGVVMIQTTLEPALLTRRGHKIQFYLDDTPHGTPLNSTSVTMSNLDRGEHILTAAVIGDKDEIIIRTQPVKIYLHKSSNQHPNSLLNPDNPNSPLHPDNPGNPNNIPGLPTPSDNPGNPNNIPGLPTP